MKVVFIVPCYNAEKNLDNLANSLKQQNNKNWSCIFIDDISSDNTWKKINEITLSDSRFEGVKNKVKKFYDKSTYKSTTRK